MRITKLIYLFSLIIFVLVVAMAYFTEFFMESTRETIATYIYIFPLFVLGAVGVNSFAKYKKVSLSKNAFLFMLIGSLLWIVGELILVTWEIVLSAVVFPSIGDLFILMGYPFFFMGIAIAAKDEKIKFGVFSILLSLISAAVFIFITVRVSAPFYSSANIWENITGTAYWIGDCFLIIGAILLINLAKNNKDKSAYRDYIILAFAQIISWAADLVYIVYFSNYNTFNWVIRSIDIVWMLEYILIAYVFYSNSEKKENKIKKKIKRNSRK